MTCPHPECTGNHNGSGSAKGDVCPAAYERKLAAKRNWAVRRRARLAAIKLERGCIDCGYNAHAEALDFDHLPGSEKKGNLATMLQGPWELIEAELAKCVVRCANCHRVVTAQRAREGR